MPDKDIDRREDVLNYEYRQFLDRKGVSSIYPPLFPAAYKDAAKMAMDEYMKECCLELLEYMAKNKVQCGVDRKGEMIFWYAGEWLSKEQLFENFL